MYHRPFLLPAVSRAHRRAQTRAAAGTTILFVEQNLDTILAISERCYVADKGTIIAEISRDQLRTSDAVRQHLLI